MDAIQTTISEAARARLSELSAPARRNAVAQSGDAAAPGGFAGHIAKAVSETDSLIQRAESHASELAEGRGDSVDTIIAVSKADLALRHLVTLRNRALEAYQEVMKMPL